MNLKDITEFLTPEKQEELREIYGKNVSSWEDVKKWDDLVTKEEKALINELRDQNLKKCPFLKKKDNYFYFCGSKAEKLSEVYKLTDIPKPDSVEYKAKIDYVKLQLYCMLPREQDCECMNFKFENKKQSPKNLKKERK